VRAQGDEDEAKGAIGRAREEGEVRRAHGAGHERRSGGVADPVLWVTVIERRKKKRSDEYMQGWIF
jgi:hypothetical protein